MDQIKLNNHTHRDDIRVSGNDRLASTNELSDLCGMGSGPLALQSDDTPVPRKLISTQARSARTKVLVVEDNAMDQRVLEGYLQGHQAKTVIVNNGPEAVERLRNESFDIIFINIQMPDFDGYTTTQVIRQQLLLNTPVIAMTAHPMATDEERCLGLGMNEYLAKPIRVRHLDDVLARFIQTPENRKNVMNTTDDIGADVIHVSFLDELLDGDNELLTELVTLFMRDLESSRQTLFNSVQQNDQALFKQTSHKFRSSINSLAMIDIAKKLKHLETDSPMNKQVITTELTTIFREIDEGLVFLKKRVDPLDHN